MGGMVLSPSNVPGTLSAGALSVGTEPLSIQAAGGQASINEANAAGQIRIQINASTAILIAFGTVSFGPSFPVTINGNIGFYGGAPQAKPTVTGAKGSNAALGSLMTALAALGLVTDSTTA